MSCLGQRKKTHSLLAGAQVRLALEVLFEGVQGVAPDMGGVQTGSSSSGSTTAQGKALSTCGDVLRVADTLTLTHRPGAGAEGASALLEWEGGPVGDVVADAVIAVILQVPGRCCTDTPCMPSGRFLACYILATL